MRPRPRSRRGRWRLAARLLAVVSCVMTLAGLVAQALNRRRLRRWGRTLIGPVLALGTLAGAMCRRRPRRGLIISIGITHDNDTRRTAVRP